MYILALVFSCKKSVDVKIVLISNSLLIIFRDKNSEELAYPGIAGF